MDGEEYQRDPRGETGTPSYTSEAQPPADGGSGDQVSIPTTYASYRAGRLRPEDSDDTQERFLPLDPAPRQSPYGPPPGYQQATLRQAAGAADPPPSYGAPSHGAPSYGAPSYGAPSRSDSSPPTGGFGATSPGGGGATSYGSTPYGSTPYDTTPYDTTPYGTTPGYGASYPPPTPYGAPGHGAYDAYARGNADAEDGGRGQSAWARVREETAPLRAVRTRRHVRRDEDDATTQNRRAMPLWQELPLLLVVAFCLAVLIRTFLLQAFYIPSSSMEETLLIGDRVLVNKIVYDFRGPQRGEVVVFRGTDNWAPEFRPEPSSGLLSRIGQTLGDLVGVSRPGEKDFIKRVIGLPGDRVSCCDAEGRVFVNGVPMDEPYVYQNSPLDVDPDPRVCRSRRFDEVVVPPGQIFVMGDHRLVSQDARCQGPVPIENIIGRAFVIVWPSSRWATLTVPDNFASVPGPVAFGVPGASPTTPQLAAAAVTLPLLASLVVSRRSGRGRRWGRRTLRK